MERTTPPSPVALKGAKNPLARPTSILRALKKHRTRLLRKLEAIRGDLAEAQRANEFWRYGEATLAYLHDVLPERPRSRCRIRRITTRSSRSTSIRRSSRK